MPKTPKIDVATPTVAADMPRPPVNIHGKDRDVVSFGDERGEERKSVHMLVNAPS